MSQKGRRVKSVGLFFPRGLGMAFFIARGNFHAYFSQAIDNGEISPSTKVSIFSESFYSVSRSFYHVYNNSVQKHFFFMFFSAFPITTVIE